MCTDNIRVNIDLLTQLRAENNLSLSDVSLYLGYKTPTGYWLIEAGQRGISVAVLYMLSLLYHRPMEEFLIVEKDEEQ